MKRFLGLLKKEWKVQYKWFISTFVLSLFITLGIPYFVNRYMNFSLDIRHLIFVTAFSVSIFTFLIACIQLIRNLNQELKHPDIWLHSTASFVQLMGAKIVFNVISNLIFVLLMTFVMIVVAANKEELTIIQDMKFIIAVIYLSSLVLEFLVPQVLLLYTCYLQLKKWVGKFAIFMVFTVFFIFSKVMINLSASTFYENFFSKGIKTSDWIIHFVLPISKIFSFNFTLDDIYLSEDLFSCLMTIVLIIFSTKWCEKVVKQ